jgi:FkbM family methyltransferase
MASMVRRLLNKIVRGYVYYSPVTSGKRQLLSLTRELIRPDEPVCVFTTKHGFRFSADLRDPNQQRIYFYGEHDERYEIRQLRRILRSGDTCWDIGANIGFFTCFFARRVGARGRVVAFEPVPLTASRLYENVRLNDFPYVTIVQKALGDAPGRLPIYRRDERYAEGTASLRVDDASAGHVSDVVEVETIDRLADTLPPPDFIKIDVEGYQWQVLQGATGFFARHRPMLMAELDDPDKDLMRRTEGFFRERGYEVYEFRKRCLEHCPDTVASRSRNFLLCPSASPYRDRIASLLE